MATCRAARKTSQVARAFEGCPEEASIFVVLLNGLPEDEPNDPELSSRPDTDCHV